ncbi:hypothetical protein [Bradyrhizobium guangdongense]
MELEDYALVRGLEPDRAAMARHLYVTRHNIRGRTIDALRAEIAALQGIWRPRCLHAAGECGTVGQGLSDRQVRAASQAVSIAGRN